jgi:hypothetical protein
MMILTFDRVVRESSSGLALLLDFGGGSQEWLPKSQLEELNEPQSSEGVGTVLAPEWLVLEKGLDAYAEEYD